MKTGKPFIIIGIIMFGMGLTLFYAIEADITNKISIFIKNMGTFIGFSGMGVTLAGVLLYLINKNEPAIQESFDN